MIIKALGIFDVFVGIVFWLFGIFHIISSDFILLLGLILLIKGIVFLTGLSIISFLDIICGGIIILAVQNSITLPKIVVIIISLFLIQKGVFSLLG